MDITYDNTSTGSIQATDELTFSHTISGDSNRVLVVSVGAEGGGIATGITYNGVAMTKIGSIVDGSITSELWYMLEAELPSTGSYDVVATFTGSGGLNGSAISLYNIAQQAPEAFENTNTHTPTVITDSITTLTNGAMVIWSASHNGNTTTMSPSVGTERYDFSSGQHRIAGGTIPYPSSGSHELTVTLSGGNTFIALSQVSFAPLAPSETINVEESLGFAETVELDVSNETIDINEGLGFSESNIVDDGAINIFESLGFAETDELSLSNETIDIGESLGFAETIVTSIAGTVNNASQVISYNPLVIITDTDPVTVTKVDVSNPAIPTWDRFVINVPPETVTNAKDITYNASNGFLYISCADGQLLKIDITDFDTRTQIDTGDLNNLIKVDNLPTYFKTYASTDNATGEIILLDEAETEAVVLDIRYLQTVEKTVLMQANTVLANIVDVDARVLSVATQAISLDIRFLKFDYSVVSNSPIDFTDWIVKINGVDMVPINDIDMKSIIVSHNTDNKSTTSFVLHRQHDKLNFTNSGASSQITNNNSVTVHIDGNLVFSGKVSSIQAQSEGEIVHVTAQATAPSSQKHTVNIPLASVGEQLNLYHCLVDNVNVDNPFVDPSEEDPEYYKGIKYDRGTSVVQHVVRKKSYTNVIDKINAGTFVPKQDRSYFWLVAVKYLANGGVFGSTSTTNTNYIGTSLSPVSSEILELEKAFYHFQIIQNNSESSLGFAYIGEAPFLEVSGPNGQLKTSTRWEDRSDGLYNVRDQGYNNLNIIAKIAELEYEKLQNINGDILPITSADIDLSINAYFYYNIGLLTRLNITNTTTSNIYNRLNGFPVAVKSISLSSNTMRATLSCDNQKSQEELDAIDERYPDEDSGVISGSDRKRYSKYNIAGRSFSDDEFELYSLDLPSLDI